MEGGRMMDKPKDAVRIEARGVADFKAKLASITPEQWEAAKGKGDARICLK
jgi:hypothetical protein